MKVNWFSPLPPAQTDVAHFTWRILPALTASASVTLWTDQKKWEVAIESYAPVRHFRTDSMPWPELSRAEVSFYNIGNNHLFHEAIWEVSRRQPGIAILHEHRLHHFFDSLYRVKWRDVDGYLAQMETHYGSQGRQDAAKSYREGAINIERMAELYPLTELALENAIGVVTHTREAFSELVRLNRWPVLLAPLPYPAPAAEAPFSARQVGPPFRLIVFGYIGRNRRLDALLEALAGLHERENFRLDIYGVVEHLAVLKKRIRALDLKRLVRIHGFVPEKTLDEALANSHLAVNLRYPTMGEASGSQLRIWSHALPSFVSNAGWYGTLPSTVVEHVRVEREVEDIQSHLRSLLRDPGRFAAMGMEARRLLEKEHSAEQYVKALLELAKESPRLRARASSRHLTQRAGRELAAWLDRSELDRATSSVARQIYSLSVSQSGSTEFGLRRAEA